MNICLGEQGWIISWKDLGRDVDAWKAATPVRVSDGIAPPATLRIGLADAYANYSAIQVSDRRTGEALLDVRVAAMLAAIPTLLVEGGRVFVLAGCWVAEVDVAGRRVVWEAVEKFPASEGWLLDDGRLVVVWELEIMSYGRDGRRVWEFSAGDIITNVKRNSPRVEVTTFEGEKLVLDERTGRVFGS